MNNEAELTTGEELIEKYTLGFISDKEFEELQLLLKKHPSLRQRLCEATELDSLLHLAAEKEWNSSEDRSASDYSEVPVSLPRQSSWETRSQRIIGLLALSTIVLLGLLVHTWYQQNAVTGPKQSASFHKKTTVGSIPIGLLTSWNPEAGEFPNRYQNVVQKALHAEDLQLESGLHELVLSSGSYITIDSPSQIELNSPTSIELQKGKIQVRCFDKNTPVVITTPRFGLKLGKGIAELMIDGEKDFLQVLKGEAEVWTRADDDADDSGSRRVMKKGTAFLFSQEDGWKPATFSPMTRFRNENARELANRYQKDVQRKIEDQWKIQSRQLQSDPRVLTYFDFQDDRNQTILPNLAIQQTRKSDSNSPGVNFGCKWSLGRWPWKRALEFKRLDQYVHLNVPGSHRKLTLFASLRVDRLDWPFQAIVNSDDWSSRRFHWQLRNDEPGKGVRLELGVSTESGWGEPFVSPPILDRNSLGKWITVATTVNCDTKEVKHYLDGKLVCTLPMKESQPIKIHRARIGNSISYIETEEQESIEGDAKYNVRPLNGRIDELVIFQDVLSEMEIKNLSELTERDSSRSL